MTTRPRVGRPTISDVAAMTGLSKATVSRAMNDSGRVSAQTRDRVLRTLKEIGYRRSHAATSLSTGRTGMLGLIIGANRNPTALAAIQGASTAAAATGHAVVVYVSASDSDGEHADIYSDLLSSRAVDGVVLFFPRAGDLAYLEELDRSGVRVVVVDPQQNMGQLFTVRSDAHGDGFLSATHLIDQGHRRIALCADEPGWAGQREYVEGYRQALASAGLEWDPTLVAEEGWDHGAGHAATARWLELSDPPTAICFCCDTAALGGLAAVIERGLRVPQDVALVGYDDTDVAEWVEPPLTTLRERRSKPVEEACRLLVALIDGDEPSERERLVASELRVRRSSTNVET